MLVIGEAMHAWEKGFYGKVSVPSLQLCYEPKTALKKKSNILEKLKATFENQDILNYKHKFGVVPSIVIEPSESMS